MGGRDLPQGFIRITVGIPEQNRFFIDTFRAYAEEVLKLNRKYPEK